MARQARARGAVRPVSIGDLVALPILMTPEGLPFDLLEATDGRAIVLLFVPADATGIAHDATAVAMSLAERVEATGGRLFVIASRAGRAADPGAPLIDRDGGFAYSLGLAAWDHERGCADLQRFVGLVLDEVGNVIAADLGGSPDLARLVDALPSGGTADPGRVRRG